MIGQYTPNAETWALLDAACCDGLDADQAERLETALRADERLRDFYLDYFQLHAELTRSVRLEQVRENIVESIRQPKPSLSEPHLTNEALSFPSLSPFPSLSTTPSPISPPFVGGPVFSYMVATVVLCAMLLSAWAYKITLSDGEFVDNPKSHATPMDQMEFVARITGMADCRWADPDTRPYAGSYIPLGRKYELTSGLLEITYTSGAKVVLEGPCEYTVNSDAGGYLAIGKLVARVEKNDELGMMNDESHVRNSDIHHSSFITHHLFAVTTPTAVVTDLGTEFGVEVNKNGGTTSNVFEGTVLFQTIERLQGVEQSVVLRSGQTARCVKGERIAVSSSSAVEDKYVRSIDVPQHSGKEITATYIAAVLKIDGNDCDCRAICINDAGQVVGVVEDIAGKKTAFIYDEGRKNARMLFGPNGEQSFAQCINNSGAVAGHFTADSDDAEEIACIWDSKGKCVRLDGAGKFVSSEAWGINDAGAASGFGVSADGSIHSFVHTASDGLADIGGLGGAISKATEINSAGQVVGYSTLAGGRDEHAHLLSDGKMIDLGAAGGLTSRAFAINNSGAVAGYYSTISSIRGAQAFILRIDSERPKMEQIASLGTFSIAFDVNDFEQVVGRYWSGIDMVENYKAFVYANGKMHDLNELADLPNGYVLRQARGINNTGQIAAWGTDGSGREFACLLTPAAAKLVEEGGDEKK